MWHLNAGRERTRGAGSSNFAGVGVEWPVVERLQLTAEVVRVRDGGVSMNTRQLGVRWEAAAGLKLCAAGAKASGMPTATTLGFAWEF